MDMETRDPLFRGLDELAGSTDQIPATHRMAGIARKARNNRRRRAAAGVAGLAVIAAGTVGAVQLLSDGGSSTGSDIADDPPTARTGLTIDVTVTQTGPKSLDVDYRIHGTAHEWSDPTTGRPTGDAGPRFTTVKLDGRDVGGTDGGDIECRPGASELAYDETFDGVVPPVRVPGPGTYTVTVEAPYCADGKVVPYEVSTTVIMTEAGA